MKTTHLVLKIAFALTAATVCSSALADAKDLKTFDALLDAGAEIEQFMSQMHVGIDDISCSYSVVAHETQCNMTDISANEGQGAPLTVNGKKAQKIFAILARAGAPTDNGMGKVYITGNSIRCSQAMKGVMDGSAAARTQCSINVGEANAN